MSNIENKDYAMLTKILPLSKIYGSTFQYAVPSNVSRAKIKHKSFK